MGGIGAVRPGYTPDGGVATPFQGSTATPAQNLFTGSTPQLGGIGIVKTTATMQGSLAQGSTTRVTFVAALADGGFPNSFQLPASATGYIMLSVEVSGDLPGGLIVGAPVSTLTFSTPSAAAAGSASPSQLQGGTKYTVPRVVGFVQVYAATQQTTAPTITLIVSAILVGVPGGS